MDIEMAMAYEYIVRVGNGSCGRYGVAGADADIFRNLERKWAKGVDGKYVSTVEDRYFAIGEVSAYLRDALARLTKSEKFNDEVKVEFQRIYDTLSFATLDDIDAAVIDASKLLKIA